MSKIDKETQKHNYLKFLKDLCAALSPTEWSEISLIAKIKKYHISSAVKAAVVQLGFIEPNPVKKREYKRKRNWFPTAYDAIALMKEAGEYQKSYQETTAKNKQTRVVEEEFGDDEQKIIDPGENLAVMESEMHKPEEKETMEREPDEPKPEKEKIDSERIEKPPLGLTPEFIWKEKRMNDIEDAIKRYLNDKKEIPLKWISEYNRLIGEYHMLEIVS